MTADSQSLAIVFADICDSTPLYEEHGDMRALEIVAGRLDELAGIAGSHDGAVIRSKGDDVLCTFGDPAAALDASAAMVAAHGRGPAAIHVGIHFGSVIHARQDIFGDAVNVAARMLAIAKPGEIVASEDLVRELGPSDRERMALLGTRELKGKQEPVAVYSLVLDEGEVTQLAWGGKDARAAHYAPTEILAATVEIDHGGEILTVHDGETCTIGRAERCDLVVDVRAVSREHARVSVSGARATVTDRSSTGTWVIDARGAHTTLRRESAVLPGTGRLRLGRHPRDPEPAPELAFRVLRGG